MSKPQLYLHIGHPKTASSTIQSYLYDNWRAIEQAGYMQPTPQLGIATSGMPPGNPLWTLVHMKNEQTVTPITDWIAAASSTAGFNGKLLLSSESLAQPAWPSLFAPVSKIADIHLIYYVRRQDKLLLSAWRQWGVKRGLELDTFIERRCKNTQPDFNAIVSAWETQARVARHHVRFIDTPLIGAGDVIDDLAAQLQLDTGSTKRPHDQNVSVDARLLVFFARYPSFFSSVHDETIFELLRDDRKQPEVRATLSEAQFRLIKNTFEPLNQKLLAGYDPAHSGHRVICEDTAPVRALPDWAESRDYVAARLSSCDNKDHPLLEKLTTLIRETK